jgi:hypothetical protein
MLMLHAVVVKTLTLIITSLKRRENSASRRFGVEGRLIFLLDGSDFIIN